MVTGCRPLPSSGGQRCEAEGIDGVVVDPQQVAGGAGKERLPLFSQCPAKTGNVDAQSTDGSGRRSARPELLGQHVGGDDPVGGHHEQREEGTFAGTLEAKPLTVAHDLKRTENPVFEGQTDSRDPTPTGDGRTRPTAPARPRVTPALRP